MNTYGVVFAPEAEEDLVSLYEYIAEHGSPEVAAKYTDAIVTYCESLGRLPHVGQGREDIRPGLRVSNYKGRTVIAFTATTLLAALPSSASSMAGVTTNASLAAWRMMNPTTTADS